MAQLWGGRFTKETDQLVYNFNASISFDQKFYEQDIRGSKAHVKMLAKQGILTEEERDKILEGLEGILAEMMDYAYENGLMAENSIVYKDLFDTKIMGCLVPEPSSVRKTFRDLYEHTSPLAATDYFYKLSCDSNYIRRQRIKKDRKWTTDTCLLYTSPSPRDTR